MRASPSQITPDRHLRWAALLLVVWLVGPPASQASPCSFMCGDLDGDGSSGLSDFGFFVACMGQLPDSDPACGCADMDGSGTIDMHDFALFQVTFGQLSDETPPHCTGAVGTSADLTAYRPQHGGGYAPFARTAVADADEDSPTLGPGIRINVPGDIDPDGEDDLIEVELTVDPPGAAMALRRTDPALAVWTTRDQSPGTEIAFVDDKTDALPLGPDDSQLTVWVEWASPNQGTAELRAEPVDSDVAKDMLMFHTFQSIVVALGGEDQVPSDPPDPSDGTFAVAIELYHLGYDVHMYDEDHVAADGTGTVFDEIANAIQNRDVSQVAIFGYSHGGGSTYDLADLLDVSRPALGTFEIEFTSYVDAVRNNSDFDMAQELRRPPSTVFHLNQYQHGVFWQDLGLDGGPVPDSNPPPTGLDVETTDWGADATHFTVDDFVEVRDLIQSSLMNLVIPEQVMTAMPTPDQASSRNRALASGHGALSRVLMPLLLVAVPLSAQTADDQPAGLRPDPPMQAAIGSLWSARTEPEQAAALAQLQQHSGISDEELVRQLLYFSMHAGRMEGAMTAGAVIRRLDIPDGTVIAALVPLLETSDAGLQKAVRNVLGGFEGRAAGRRPDFSAYRELIASALAQGRQPPSGLVRYLYSADAGEALLTLMRANQLRQPAEIKPILWGEHVISDVLWKQQNGFLNSDQIEPAAAAEVVRLAGHEAWWVRLYAAEIMAQHPAFRAPGLVRQLTRDRHPLVREVATEISPQP